MRRGRVLAVKWGMNPNSSSMGVDVTFLLLGASALALMTPVVGAMLRWRRPRLDDESQAEVAGTSASTPASGSGGR